MLERMARRIPGIADKLDKRRAELEREATIRQTIEELHLGTIPAGAKQITLLQTEGGFELTYLTKSEFSNGITRSFQFISEQENDTVKSLRESGISYKYVPGKVRI